MLTKFKARCNKAMYRMITGQKGDLPSWVNILLLIVIIVVLGLAVWRFLSPAIKDGITNYVNQIFSGII